MGMAQPSNKSSRVVMSEINVTPFVDVMLVLLVIFMVTAPMMQQGIDVDLPETAATGTSPSDEPFILEIKKNGRIFVGKNQIDMPQLSSKLKAIFATRKNKEIFIQADKSVSYGIVAQAMGEIKSAGISQIGLVTLPKGSSL